MTPPPNATAANQKKVYRFALYGRRNSGKTCILASLAMERVAHPDGLSCTWLDTPYKGASPSREQGNQIEEEVTAAFTHGKDWLEQAIRNLEQGAVPPPNPNDKDAFSFMYEFTAEDHRTFLVELIDYSGELIDPDLSDTDLAKRLRQHMLTMDGILVLAEAPYPSQLVGELYKELQRLKRAFAALRGEKQDGPALAVPVALLINKWDRRVEENYQFSPQNSDNEVQEFLDSQPEPPHRGLVNTLRGSVAEGLFRAFPVSAFGKHVLNGEMNGNGYGARHPERPAQVNPLCSFGLEDGFVWACRCRDQIDVKEFEAEANSRAWWKLWQLLDGKSRMSLRSRASELGKRFPDTSEENRRVCQAARRNVTASAGQWGLVAVIMPALLYLGVGVFNDRSSYNTYRPTFANLQVADKEQLNQAETWLENYVNNKYFFHTGFRLILTRENADAQLVAIREWKRDSVLAEWNERWKEIERAPDEVTREGLAKKLRNDLRGARYSDDNILAKCNSLLEECEANRKIRDNIAALQTLEAEFTNLVSSKSEVREEYRRIRRRAEDLPVHKDSETKEFAEQRLGLVRRIDYWLDEIEKLDIDRKNVENMAFITEQERRLEAAGEVPDLELIMAGVKRGMPYAEIASNEVQQRYTALRFKAQDKLDDAIRRREWLKYEDEYHALMRRGNLREAAQRLVEKGKDFTGIEALKADFCQKCLPQLEDKKGELVRGKQWDRARETLKTIRTDKYAKTLLTDEQLRKIEDMEHEVNVHEDKHLYAQVENRKTRTMETIQKYLADAPLKTMKLKVEDYRDYLRKMDGVIELEVEGTVLWGPNCWNNYKNLVKIIFGSSELFNAEAISTPNGSSDIGSKSFTQKLNDTININVSIKITDGFIIFNSREHGKGTFEGNVSDLLGGGKTIELDKYGNKVVLKINKDTLPKEPILPEWRE
jgi:hypothetical protein